MRCCDELRLYFDRACGTLNYGTMLLELNESLRAYEEGGISTCLGM